MAIYTHFSQAPWDAERWPNFKPKELACKHCGQYYHWPEYLDGLQSLRTISGKPINITSAHRCWRHNIAVGGAPRSQHKKLATDISLRGHDRHELAGIARVAGFTGFGFYNTFLHIDKGRSRYWYGKGAKEAWT